MLRNEIFLKKIDARRFKKLKKMQTNEKDTKQ